MADDEEEDDEVDEDEVDDDLVDELSLTFGVGSFFGSAAFSDFLVLSARLSLR